MKISYDAAYRPITIDISDQVYLKLVKKLDDRGYRLLDNTTKLLFRKLGPYKVIDKISPVTFKIELLD
jgi:hypothetical protein